MAKVSGGRVRGKPRLVYGVKVGLGNREMVEKAAHHCTKDRKECRALVHM